VSHTYKPLLVKYLSSTRSYSYKSITLQIPPQVFHPRFFYSTRLLLRYLDSLQIKQRSFLELGAGSGLIALWAAQKGASVTASDINPTAVEYLHINKLSNKANIRIIQSDLFDEIPEKKFDFIAINPPYYKKNPQSFYDHSWYCGQNGEYFKKLFSQLGKYIGSNSKVIMCLSEECDVMMIQADAMRAGFDLKLVYQRQNLVERNYIFQIQFL
jgi:release factor glutamine methyltransferase